MVSSLSGCGVAIFFFFSHGLHEQYRGVEKARDGLP